MKNMKKNKCLQRIFVWITVLSLCFSCGIPAMAAPASDIIYIRNEKELSEISRNCSYDAWSKGKTVVLEADILLENEEFLSIPSFGGRFDGNGHTISGLNITESLSPAGFFGILQTGAVVENLTVKGKFVQGSSGKNTGGIVGINQGTIQNCFFSGSITGGENVGGIAGSNSNAGKIQKCEVSGKIQGEKMTGGIVGYNEGAVLSCENRSSVNTKSTDPKLSLENIDMTTAEGILGIASLDTISVASDTGGIVGGSAGMLSGCVNKGVIGYPHIGYNVGGIAGRSSGYTSSCENRGRVYGRKDVGGIVGQVVSHITMDLSEDVISRVEKEMEALSELVDKAAADAENASGNITGHISDMNASLGKAKDSTQKLSDSLKDYGDTVIDEVNRESEIFKETLSQLSDITAKMKSDAGYITNAINLLQKSIDEMAKASEFSETAIRDMQKASKDLTAALTKLEKGTSQIAAGMDKLQTAVKAEDKEATKAALEMIQSGIEDVGAAFEASSAALTKLLEAIQGTPVDSDKVEAALREMADALQAFADAAKKINTGLAALEKNISFDLDAVTNGIDKIQAGLKNYQRAFAALEEGLEHMDAAMADLKLTAGQLTTAVESLSEAVGAFSGVSSRMNGRISEMADLLDYLKNAKQLTIPKTGTEAQESVDTLYSCLNTMNQQVETLNQDMAAATDVLIQDIQNINHQFMDVMDAMIAAVYDTGSTSVEDYFVDTSEENIDSVTTGKTCESLNLGEICGDINVGGIVGSMGIEDELDPESDIETGITAGYKKRYELKAIVQKCVNKGEVSARRNYAGAVCGHTSFGLITECEGYGKAVSESGNYVGGIAGFSSGVVRNSFAKCSLEGKKYVGGIVGASVTEEGKDAKGTIAGCYSLVEIVQADQYAGAISGIDKGTFLKNYFVSEKLAGIDRVSFSGRAEPISYKELLKVKGLPEEFKEFTLCFLSDGEAIKTESFAYNESFDEAVFPEAPVKKGYYAEWDKTELLNLKFDTDVNVVYNPYVTALESDSVRESGRSIFFVEGSFRLEDELRAEQLKEKDLEGLSMGSNTLLEQWKLVIPDDGMETHAIRYLPEEEKTDNLIIYVKQEEGWKKAEPRTIGSYLVFDAEGRELTLAVLKKPFWHIW